MRQEKKLGGDPPILTPKADYLAKHMSTTNIRDIIYKPMRIAGSD